MTIGFKSLAALASLCLVSPLTAMAQDYRVVYDGTITAGSDTDNVFGLSQRSSLAGLTFTAAVRYTTSVPETRSTASDSSSDEVSGGIGFGTDPVISSIFFSVGGKGFTFSPDYYGDVYTSASVLTTYGYDTSFNSFQTYFLPNGNAGPTMFGVPFSGTGTGDTGGEATQYSYFAIGQDDIDFDTTRATVSSVPEPTSWAMLLLGFGVVGFALRRRGGYTVKSFAKA